MYVDGTKVDILLIQEIKMKPGVFKMFINSFWASSNFLASDAGGSFGGISTLWNPSFIDGTLIHLAKKN